MKTECAGNGLVIEVGEERECMFCLSVSLFKKLRLSRGILPWRGRCKGRSRVAFANAV